MCYTCKPCDFKDQGSTGGKTNDDGGKIRTNSPVWTQTLASTVWLRQRNSITKRKHMLGCKRNKKNTIIIRIKNSFVSAPLFSFLPLQKHFSLNPTSTRHTLFGSLSLFAHTHTRTHHPVSNYTLSLLLSAVRPLPWWSQRHKDQLMRPSGAERRESSPTFKDLSFCVLIFLKSHHEFLRSGFQWS